MMTNLAGLIKRREFIKLLRPGIYFLFSSDWPLLGQQFQRRFRGYPEDFNAYLRIAEDGRVTCFSGKVELGQGVITSLAQMLAEELEPKGIPTLILEREYMLSDIGRLKTRIEAFMERIARR